ncbi:hypothetical protein RB195_025398 [Necator americanus]|uniref:Endonuclease/exonuclease/phosphatase domain-containing protein n=1 Tax=Necator americanus TaxID=51031 RepID=A0ABR1EU97_NECAM
MRRTVDQCPPKIVLSPPELAWNDFEYADNAVIFVVISAKVQHIVNFVSKLAAAMLDCACPVECKQNDLFEKQVVMRRGLCFQTRKYVNQTEADDIGRLVLSIKAPPSITNPHYNFSQPQIIVYITDNFKHVVDFPRFYLYPHEWNRMRFTARYIELIENEDVCTQKARRPTCCKSYLTPQSGAAVALAVGQLWWRDFVSAGSTMPQRCPASSPAASLLVRQADRGQHPLRVILLMSTMCSSEARAYPRSEMALAYLPHCSRPGNVANMRGLPARGRSRPKKLVRHRQQHPVRLATLNVGTLTGRSRELADSLRKRRVDICCVQETRWKGSKARELGGGYKLIYHGTSNRNGVGIILNESFRNSVTAVDRLSDRLMAVKVDTGEVELRVVSAYAPQAGCSEEEKACFWKDLEQYVQSLENEEVFLIGGDFNRHVGSRKDGFEGCHGGYGFGARNDDGLRILDVIRLIAENTLGRTTLAKPKVQKATWFWNEEVQAAIREKKSKYKLWWRTRQPEDRDAYLAAKREAKKVVSKAKLDRCKAVYDMLDTREGERAVYRLVRARHRSTLDMEHTKIVKGADGTVLRRPGQILERWRECYNHLCNEEFCHPPIATVPSVEGPVLPITAVEVSAALAKMKSNKAT